MLPPKSEYYSLEYGQLSKVHTTGVQGRFKAAISLPELLTHVLTVIPELCVLNRFSPVQLFATPWTVTHQAPLCMGLSRPEYWSGLPCPSPEDLPNRGIEPVSLLSPALSGWFFTTRANRAAPIPELLMVLKIMIVVIGEVLTVCQTQCQQVTSALSH